MCRGRTGTFVEYCVVLAAFLLISGATSGQTWNLVSAEWEPSPDGNGVIHDITSYLLSDSGTLVFRADLSGTANSNQKSTILGLKEGTHRVRIYAQGLDPIGQEGERIARVSQSQPRILSDGGVYFTTNVYSFEPSVRGDQVTVSTGPNGSEVVLREGWDLGFTHLSNFGDEQIHMNANGKIAGMLSGFDPSYTQHIALIDSNEASPYRILTEIGDAAPDGNGNLSQFFYRSAPYIDSQDRVTYFAGLSDTLGAFASPIGNNSGTDDSGLFRATIDGVVQLAREGEMLAGIGTLGEVGRYFYPSSRGGQNEVTMSPRVNENGETVFYTEIRNSLDGLGDGVRLFVTDEAGGLTQIAGNNLPNPAGDGSVLQMEFNRPAQSFGAPPIGPNGEVVFTAGLANTDPTRDDNAALFFWSGSALEEVFRHGSPSPDGQGIVTRVSAYAPPNASSQIVFTVDVSTSNGHGTDSLLVRRDADGMLTPLLRTGFPVLGTFVDSISSATINADGTVAANVSLRPLLNAAPRTAILVFTASAFSVAGDYNNDGFVSQADLDLVLLNWGMDTRLQSTPDQWRNELPFGVIGQAELDPVLLNWGDGAPLDVVSIPEPASSGALAMLGLVLTFRRRRAA